MCHINFWYFQLVNKLYRKIAERKIKTNYIKKEIHNFKKEIKEIDKKILFINYGSFYRDERKFINDVDIHCVFKTNNIELFTENIPSLLSMLK